MEKKFKTLISMKQFTLSLNLNQFGEYQILGPNLPKKNECENNWKENVTIVISI